MKFLFELILLVFLSVSVIEAQQPNVSPTPPPVENEDCGLMSPELVTLNVSVWSKNKGYLKGLSYKDFEIFDGKERQEIDFFKQKDEPASVGILFDLSESMGSSRSPKLNEIPLAVEGLISFINASNSKNEYFIIVFAHEVSVLLEPTQDKKEIETALKILLTGKLNGNTSVYDAMNKGFEKISKGKFDKKILLVLSDGIDNSSKNSFADTKKQTKQNSNVMIYLVNIITDNIDAGSLESLQADSFFQTMTENSGGRIFYPKSRGQVVEAFEALADELSSQYVIGFCPKDSKEKDSWHKINVNLSKETKESAGKFFVRAQKGFYY